MTLSETLVAAVLLGFVTIPHCLVMCGPVAVMACERKGDRLAYVGGRLVAYAFVGTLMGVIGAHAFTAFGSDRVGRVTLVMLAATCVWQSYKLLRPASPKLVQLGARPTRLVGILASWLPRRGLGLGMATAVFPCGALPAAWVIAASSGHALSGAAAMLTFAVASTPGLLMAVGGRALLQRLVGRRGHQPAAGQRARAVAGAVVWLLVAVALVARAWLVETSCHG